jgi:tRNA A-37 threonylcarbamoyl transferase component Bud32
MNAVSACPGPASLQEYLLGGRSDATAASMEEHLAACPACRALLPTIRAEDDFVADFRAQARRPPSDDGLRDRLANDLRRVLGGDPAAAHHATPPADAEATPAGGDEDVRALLAPPQAPDEFGRLGDYRVLGVLGAGGMGVVFLAEDVWLRRRVALKAMRPALSANGKARQRFLREAQLTAALTHDHVVTIHHVGEENGVPFLAMPLLQGESLEARLKREGRLPLADVLRIGREAAEGLAAAHAQGLIHRDVKPANLWLEALPDGRTRVKVLDFGLARSGDGEAGAHLTQTGAVLGTPAYMTPEQAVGGLDRRADLFSLGCVLYRMTTGQAPFPGETPLQVWAKIIRDEPRPPREVHPETPPALSDLVLRLLEKDPARRPSSAAEVIQALQALEKNMQIKGEKKEQKPAAAAPRRRLVVAALALLAGLIAVGAAALTRIPTGPGEKAGGERESAGVDDAWVRWVAALPAEEQVKAGAVKLKDLNPGFDGKVKPTVEDGVVTSLEVVTDDVTDISPVRALPGLKILVCRGSAGGKGRLSDLSPLRGLPLTQLDCTDTKASNLSPLEGMPLANLYFRNTRVDDLSPLTGMKLGSLDCGGTRVTSLAPLRGMPLTYLSCRNTPVDDLSPLKRLPQLRSLECQGTPAPDLSQLKGTSLTALNCDFNPELDAEVLRSIGTLEQINGKPAKEFWNEVADKKRDKGP